MTMLLLVACGQDISVELGQEGCEGYDFSDPQESDLAVEWTGEDSAKVARRFDLQPMTSLTFEPEVVPDGSILHVYELWTGGVDEQEFCYQPYLLVAGLGSGIEVRWYEGKSQAPWSTVELEPE
jgi:hypothetical protein